MHAIILSIGDELVLGQTVDTNTAWLAARLARQGIQTHYHQTLPDDLQTIAQAITQASKDADLVLITGGVGPTEDDLTRQALAHAMKQPLEIDDASLAHLEQFFASRGKAMPERNRVQAMRPAGAQMLRNDNGTAPGLKAKLNRATIFVTPGVPREMFAMFKQSIEPELAAFGGGRQVILATKINTFGMGESNVAERLGELMDRGRNPKVGTTVSNGYVSIRVRSEYATAQQAQQKLDETLQAIREKLGSIVFGQDDDTLQEAVVKLLERSGNRLVTAESCTGGLLGAMVTDVPGCSQSYLGGWVTYSNIQKITQLHVPKDMLAEHGAVSEPVAKAMAEGALRHSHGSDVALSTTGIAGPEGGSEEKPVGTVWVGLAWRDQHNTDHIESQAVLLRLTGDRDAVRDRAAKSALQMLRLHLLGTPMENVHWAASSAANKK